MQTILNTILSDLQEGYKTAMQQADMEGLNMDDPTNMQAYKAGRAAGILAAIMTVEEYRDNLTEQ